MPHPDTGNFNKFLASLGLLLLGAALVIPYFYFQNTEILAIPSTELRSMTPTGRAAITGRQDAIASLEAWVVAAAIAIGVIGLFFLVFGTLRLRSAQEREDEEGELRRDRARLEMRQLSPAERADRLNEKVSSEDEDEDSAAVEGPSSAGPSLKSSQPHDRLSSLHQVRAAALARVQSRLGDIFNDKSLLGYRLKPQILIRGTGDVVRVDGLFQSELDHLDDVVLDLLISDPRSIQRSARNRANELIALVARLGNMSSNPTRGWLVVVIPKEWEEDVDREAIDEAGKRLRETVGAFGSATVLAEKDMVMLPHLFEYEFAPPLPDAKF